MPTVPSDTRFIGFAQQVNLQENKSANINALSQPYTMADIAASASIPQFDFEIVGGVLDQGSYCNCMIKSVQPATGNSFELVNFWETQISTDGQSVIIPNESYFIQTVISDNGSGNLESISIPNLININVLYFSSPNLTSVNIGEIGGTLKKANSVQIVNSALSEETVNYVLALLVSLDGTNGTILYGGDVYLDGGTSAAPTGQGLIDKATIESRGGTVYTN